MEKSATVNRLNPSDIEQLRRLSTCLAASAIESFQVRLANTGFADSSVRDLPGSSLDRGVRSYGQDPQRQVPAAAQEIVLRRERGIGLCRAPDFSIEKLRQAIQQSDGNP
jgi:hypothetical protein